MGNNILERSRLVAPPMNYTSPAEIRIVEAENGVVLYVNNKLFVFTSPESAMTELKRFLESK